MNETEFIIKELTGLLKVKKLSKDGIRSLAEYLNISHTAIYNMIKNDRITIKFYKLIKTDENLKEIYISENYILNKILMGY